MDIQKMGFETRFVETKQDVTTKVVEAYLKYLGYTINPHYVSLIRHGKTFNLSNDIISILNKYDIGFPDFLLEKNGEVEFVKYRYNNTLNFEQLRILKELSNHIKVTLIYFIKESLNVGEDFKTNLLLTYEKGRDRGFKPLWVAAELYKKLGNELYDKDNMKALSEKIKIKEDKIRFFLEKTVGRSEIKKVINKLPV
jgi:hypothetical protein